MTATPGPAATSQPTPAVTPAPTTPVPPAAQPLLAAPEGDSWGVAVAVIDGFTVAVEVDGQIWPVRYIGVGAGDLGDISGCFRAEATARNRELVEGRTVWLERDVSQTDAGGLLLRYVWVDGVMVNSQLVFEGYLRVRPTPPDLRWLEELQELETEARAAGAGLWSACHPAAASP